MTSTQATTLICGIIHLAATIAPLQAQSLTRVEAPPLRGTFFSAQFPEHPPYPFNPLPELDVYSFENIFVFDDRKVDYSSQKSESPFSMNSAGEGPPVPGEGGGGESTNNVPPAYSYTTNDLWLEITGVTNEAADFVIHTPQTNSIYDLFSTTNLVASVPGLNLTNWIWLLRSAAGETNLVLTNLPVTQVESYYRLGTMQDSDADGLTDAYELLVSHTDPNDPDTDGDGLSDFYELLHGLSPFVSQGIPSLSSISIPVCPFP